MQQPAINRIKGTALFLGLFFIFTTLTATLIYSKGNEMSFLWLNQAELHDKTNDFLFKYITHIGDGFFAVAISLMFLLIPRTQRLGLVSLIAYALSGLLAQLIKRTVEAPRPAAIFTNDTYSFFVDGIHNATQHSFPSGHTTTIFAMCCVLACFSRHKWLQVNFLLLAIIVGYSRIYLGQHFPADVLGGAFLGTFMGLLTVYFSDKIGYKKPISIFGRTKHLQQNQL